MKTMMNEANKPNGERNMSEDIKKELIECLEWQGYTADRVDEVIFSKDGTAFLGMMQISIKAEFADLVNA